MTSTVEHDGRGNWGLLGDIGWRTYKRGINSLVTVCVNVTYVCVYTFIISKINNKMFLP